ncbi:MAG: flagellar filament capping protein FliD [Anaerolineales bacterium]|nr:flagellar filament capping protein FliD [Anaerolineales bacterium]
MTTVSSTSSYTGNLSTYFTNLINNIMTAQSVKLTTLEGKLDTLNTRNAVYNDVETMLKDLQSSAFSLISTSYSKSFISGRTAEVSGVDEGDTVLTATASKNAVAGTYDITNISRALAHRVSSDVQTYTDQALGLSGTILLGGAETRSATPVSAADDTVTGYGTAEVDNDQSELGTGSYFVETRQTEGGTWEFRLVDEEGKAVSIKNNSEDDEYTDDWQTIPTGGGEYDTGRGLTISFGADSELYIEKSRGGNPNPASEVAYEAQGVSIEVEESDTLTQIATKINDAEFADGNGMSATIVSGQLILTAENTGASYEIRASDLSGTVMQDLGLLTAEGGFKNEMQVGKNATFSVNGIDVERSSNSGLTDVISGVTINLAADAEGQDATITITETTTSAQDSVSKFVNLFNDLQEYLEGKTGVTATTEDENGNMTYTRGALADDSIFRTLRSDLFAAIIDEYENEGIYSSLREIGITVDSNLSLSISDSDQFESALDSHFDDVVSLLDDVMSRIDAKLAQFTGVRSESDYIDDVQLSLNNEIGDVQEDIEDTEEYLSDYELYLYQQYAQVQSTLISLQYMQSMYSSLSGTSSSSNISLYG